ncbi:hypothetical protein BSL78_29033 [Apostichopus japonicus]|uniref:Uncharacterized protein n=1 Tax=Stichopus japonicus TaxID=307972 RepID=A0A2G8JEH7_STIJA|nr:hypothetical protein BSL78_29033 [Apostichopus japonicus]
MDHSECWRGSTTTPTGLNFQPEDQNGQPEGLPETAGPFGAFCRPSGTTGPMISRAGPTNFSGREAQTSGPTGGDMNDTASLIGDAASSQINLAGSDPNSASSMHNPAGSRDCTIISTSTQEDSDQFIYQLQGMNLDELSTPVVPPGAMTRSRTRALFHKFSLWVDKLLEDKDKEH